MQERKKEYEKNERDEKNEKIADIEILFVDGRVSLFKLIHFLTMEIEDTHRYRVLKFKSNEGYIIKFHNICNIRYNRKYKDSIFIDLFNSNGCRLISKEILYFFEMLNLTEVKELGLMNQRWAINKIIV